MADSNVPITAGAGTAIDTRTNALGEHRQVLVLGNDGDNVQNVEAWGQAQVTQGAATLFLDDFTGSVFNTIDLWTLVSGTAPTVSGGNLVMPATISTYNAIRSQDLVPNGVGYNDCRIGIALETAAAVGAGRFWGLAVPPATTPSATSLVQDGAGFEIDQATGNLLAVTYSAGVRTTVATLTRPSDGGFHAYSVCVRTTRLYWFIDNLQNSVATVPFPAMPVLDLYLTIVRQNAASFTGTPVFNVTAAFVADTNRDGVAIADGVVPARRARVVDPARIPGAGTPATANDRTFGSSINVNPNALQKATYRATVKPTAAASGISTFQPRMSLHHLATAVKTVRIRKVNIQGSATAVAAITSGEVHLVTAAPTGTVVATGRASATAATAATLQLDGRDANPEVVVLNSVSAATSVGLLASGFLAAQSSAVVGGGGNTIYEWQPGSETKPITLRAGVLEGIVVGIIATAAVTWTLTIEVIYTEE